MSDIGIFICPVCEAVIEGDQPCPNGPHPIPDGDLINQSVLLESRTGYDSIPTVDGIAERTRSGTLRCYVPGCYVTRPDAVTLWRHLHFSMTHGYSFGVKSPEEALNGSDR